MSEFSGVCVCLKERERDNAAILKSPAHSDKDRLWHGNKSEDSPDQPSVEQPGHPCLITSSRPGSLDCFVSWSFRLPSLRCEAVWFSLYSLFSRHDILLELDMLQQKHDGHALSNISRHHSSDWVSTSIGSFIMMIYITIPQQPVEFNICMLQWQWIWHCYENFLVSYYLILPDLHVY